MWLRVRLPKVSEGENPPQGRTSRTEHCLTASALLPAAELAHSPRLDLRTGHLHANSALDVVLQYKSTARTLNLVLSVDTGKMTLCNRMSDLT